MLGFSVFTAILKGTFWVYLCCFFAICFWVGAAPDSDALQIWVTTSIIYLCASFLLIDIFCNVSVRLSIMLLICCFESNVVYLDLKRTILYIIATSWKYSPSDKNQNCWTNISVQIQSRRLHRRPFQNDIQRTVSFQFTHASCLVALFFNTLMVAEWN